MMLRRFRRKRRFSTKAVIPPADVPPENSHAAVPMHKGHI
jgi:hypothetical protein